MNNVRRTLVKTYGILFPVVGASGIKHFHSPAAGKIKQTEFTLQARQKIPRYICHSFEGNAHVQMCV